MYNKTKGLLIKKLRHSCHYNITILQLGQEFKDICLSTKFYEKTSLTNSFIYSDSQYRGHSTPSATYNIKTNKTIKQ